MTVLAIIALLGLTAIYATTGAVIVVAIFLTVIAIERYFHVR